MKYFLDTNICIGFLNGSSLNVKNKIEEFGSSKVAIPSIVAAELMYGAHKSAKREHNLMRYRDFISKVNVIGIDIDAVEEYGRIRADLESKGCPIGPNDYFIAAIAKANNATLVTNNIKEFSRVPGLLIENWI